jgi:hypothetical protein
MTRMTKILTPVAALALCLMAIVPAVAQGIDATIDVNGDGKYSYPELQTVDPSLDQNMFMVMDVNGDGLLDAAEAAAATDAGLMPIADG